MSAARASLLVLLVVAAPATGQPTPFGDEMLKGVVWSPPEDPQQAAADLRSMRDYGVEAVRMPAAEEPRLFAEADRLGLALFLDLPVERLAAAYLSDTLAFAERELESVIELAGRFRTVHGVGLANVVDTSEPNACAYFEHLAERAREAGLWTYYRAHFIESDRCSGTVDAVLLEARGRDPAHLLARWRRHHETPAGIGALGAEVRDDVRSGHLTPRSPAAQARFLEGSLRELLLLHPAPPVVFVHRWRDDTFGLHAADGTPRLAARVVAGFYTGRQTVFAIDAGPAPGAPPGATSFMILGWLTALILIALLSLAPRFRELVPRYFGRHNYYREAVQRSASLEGAAGFGVALALSIAAGIVVGVILHAVARTEVPEVAFAGLAQPERDTAVGALRQPHLTVLVGATLYGLWLLLNIVWLRALAGRRYRVRPLQATILAVLSRWQVFVLAVLALLAAQSDDPLAWLPWLLGSWVLVEGYALIRMLYDYSKVSRVPMPRAIFTGLGGPVVAAVVIIVAIALATGPQLTFLWHLATRT